jgi:uncharacterized membrane protein
MILFNNIVTYLLPNYSFMQLFLYVIVYSFLGWLIEVVVISSVHKKIIKRGNMLGPFLPIYGFGAIFMLLFFNPPFDNIYKLFLTAVVFMSAWEYFVHWSLEKIFGMKWWNYSQNFVNINGRICLLYSLCWGILGILLVNTIHPYVESKLVILNLIPGHLAILISVPFIIYLMLDVRYSILKIIMMRNKKNITSKSILDYIFI